MSPDFFFSIIILIFSTVVHEVSHGYVAYLQGDNTAKHAGRLTLNPLKHLEWFGSFLLPAMSYFFGGFIIGWAKPVPYNPYNLKPQKWGLNQQIGEGLVAFAGPASNILIAAVLGLLIRFGIFPSLHDAFALIVLINLILATFNLIPIPPLDGSKILFSLLPNSFIEIRESLERNGTFILIFFVLFLWQFVLPLVAWEFLFITSFSL